MYSFCSIFGILCLILFSFSGVHSCWPCVWLISFFVVLSLALYSSLVSHFITYIVGRVFYFGFRIALSRRHRDLVPDECLYLQPYVLLRTSLKQVQEQLIQYRQRNLTVTYERMCPVCKKRIGNSVIACYPNGSVVHFACMQNQPLADQSRD